MAETTPEPQEEETAAVAEAEPDAEEARYARVAEVTEAFSPSAPISNKDLFAGRTLQMARLYDVVSQRGRHGALFGERGVGKTSLAAVVSQMLHTRGRVSVKTNCSAGDTFGAVWRRVFGEIPVVINRQPVGFEKDPIEEIARATPLVQVPDAGPDDIRRALEIVATVKPIVIFLDEFDRLTNPELRAPFADLIKALSDYAVPVTLVVVGVADDVDELVAEHRSIARALEEILMPRMSFEESVDIVNRGLKSVSMTITPKALKLIARLSQGLPHYTHLLAQQAGISASWGDRDKVNEEDVEFAISEAIEKAQQTIKHDYVRATTSQHKDTLHRAVLRACALAQKDDLGFFAPADVRNPLSKLLNRQVDIPIFQQHLTAFTTTDRAEALQRRGEPRKYRYRFRDPLLQPYVLLRGLHDDRKKERAGKRPLNHTGAQS